MIVHIAPYVRVGITDKLKIGFGSIQLALDIESNKTQKYLSIIKKAKFPIEINQLIKYAHQIIEDSDAFIKTLLEKNILVEAILNNENNRYSRPFLFYQLNGFNAEFLQQKLQSSKLAIIGCGGIGNLISIQLNALGIGSLLLVDGDTIELSNLTRQLGFTEEDIGKHKSLVLANFLTNRNKNTEIKHINTNIQINDDLSYLKNCNLIVVSGDDEFLMQKTNKFCIANEIAYINIGYINDYPVWGPFYIPKQKGCYNCLIQSFNQNNTNLVIDSLIDEINLGYKTPSTPTINNIAASFALADIIEYINGANKPKSFQQRVGINLKTQEFMYIKANNSLCEMCCGE